MRIAGVIVAALQRPKETMQEGYRIMCIGESTTVFGEQDSYPCQLERILNAGKGGRKFTVINRGIPGADTTFILANFEKDLAVYRPEVVVAMIGINDRYPQEFRRFSPWARFMRTFKVARLGEWLWLSLNVRLQEMRMFLQLQWRQFFNGGSARMVFLSPSNCYAQDRNSVLTPSGIKKEEYLRLGELYFTQKKYSEAQGYLEKAIFFDPTDIQAYYALGKLLKQKVKLTQAKEVFKKIIELDPTQLAPYNELGGWAVDEGNYEEAISYFKKAIDLGAQDARVYIRLGWCYFARNEFQDAELTFKRNLALNPRDAEACGSLVAFYAAVGNRAALEEYSTRANEINLKRYNPLTRHNYQIMQAMLASRGIPLVCVQYPMRTISPLQMIFENKKDVVFVDNEWRFKNALLESGLHEYFIDMFAGDFGHCTPKGNRLLAESIAAVITKEIFP
ncbi:MAG: tetratricopeptide repeat protein [Candidatus Omnitrophica bacterium]|nr:tetratricopeptide repeat protein [Candidatus Omnitrophota bacterium]